MSEKPIKRGLYWFRKDLRLDDNPALSAMSRAAESAVFLFVMDERWFRKSSQNYNRMGHHRMRFMTECVRDLQLALQKKGHDLIVAKGDPAAQVLRIAKELNCSEIFAQKEHTQEETEQENQIANVISAQWLEGQTLIHPEDLPMSIDDLPAVFSRFRNKVEKKGLVIRPLSTVEVWPAKTDVTPQLDPQWMPEFEPITQPEASPNSLIFQGGTTEARERMNTYFWKKQLLSTYKNTRNGLLGWDYSSKFSPWLSWGCISARQVHVEVLRYEKEIERNESTYWLVFELLWRDYFRFVAMQYGNRIWHLFGLKERPVERLLKPTEHSLNDWTDGQTGDDFINANMRELKATGFMSNRGRQNVASYAVHDMDLDWRECAAWFERELIDFDPCSNTLNWLYVAGLGNDPRPNRKFDIPWQTERYDPEGEYRTYWNKTYPS